MTCATCANVDRKQYPGHAACGFLKCKFETLAGTFVSEKRPKCDRYKVIEILTTKEK